MPAARFTVLCDECVRIEWTPAGSGGVAERFVDEGSLFSPRRPLPRRVVIADAAAGAPPIDIRTSRMLLQFRPDGKPLSAENLCAQIALPSQSGRRIGFWRPGDPQASNLGGTIETLDGVRGALPVGNGLLSRDGWSLVDDSHGPLLVNNWVSARTWAAVPPDNQDWYFFAYGRDYAAAFRAFAHVAGPVPVPRRAALGSWYSRYWPHTSAEFRGIVADYHQHGIPLDIMVLDMDWHSGSARQEWTGWSWNRELLPDAEELLSWLHMHGLEVALNLHPADGVGPREDRYAAFMREQGADPELGERLAFDAGNRPYMTALFNEVLTPLEEAQRSSRSEVRGAAESPFPDLPLHRADAASQQRGVDFWWLDWQQDRMVPSVPGLTNLAWLNHLFYRHSAREGRRGINLSRWASPPAVESNGSKESWAAGDHRHPVHFSGDAYTGWDMLAFQVPFTVVAGNAGCFFWSHDIGGHFGPRIEECTARWCWFGALSAAMRLHSARTAVLDRRPWTYADPFASAMKAAFELRSVLMPYIDAAAHECESRGLPMLRPMYLAHPESDRAYRAHGQYMFGPDLLAAPITSPGAGASRLAGSFVWFPPASDWYNWFTHERYAGGAEAVIAAPINQAPLFAPAGVPIVTREFSHRPASEPIDHLIIRLYPGEPGRTHTRELHEDDGDTTGYRRGEFRRTPVSAAWGDAGTLTLSIGPAVGDYPGAVSRRRMTVALGAATVEALTVAGRKASATHAAGLALIEVEETSVGEAVTIEARFRAKTSQEQTAHDQACRVARAATLPGSGGAQSLAPIELAARHAIGIRPETYAPAGVGRSDSLRVCDPFEAIDEGRVQVELVERTGQPDSTSVVLRSLSTEQMDLRGQRAASVPVPGEELPQPALGLRVSRFARLRFAIGGKVLSTEAEIESRVTPIDGFRISGPYPWDWRKSITEQCFDPELAPLGAKDLASWGQSASGDKWPVDFRRVFPGAKGLAYAATVIRSPRKQMSSLHLDAGDKIEAWVNGTKVFSLDGHDTAAALISFARVELPAGESLLLIKTNDGGGGWGFSATLDGEFAVSVQPPAPS